MSCISCFILSLFLPSSCPSCSCASTVSHYLPLVVLSCVPLRYCFFSSLVHVGSVCLHIVLCSCFLFYFFHFQSHASPAMLPDLWSALISRISSSPHNDLISNKKMLHTVAKLNKPLHCTHDLFLFLWLTGLTCRNTMLPEWLQAVNDGWSPFLLRAAARGLVRLRAKRKGKCPRQSISHFFCRFSLFYFRKKKMLTHIQKQRLSTSSGSLLRKPLCVHFVCLKYLCPHDLRRHRIWNIYWPAERKFCIICRLWLQEGRFSLRLMSVFLPWQL